MPINPLALQRQMRELGRIRTGNQVPSKNGRRPNKLETFRLTSRSRELVQAAASAFGGTAIPWDNNGSPEFEVITTAAALDIFVPPGQPVSQWFEMWSGGGCQRRCDGITETISEQPCLCPADVDERITLAGRGEACKATTRLNVMLPQLPDLGVWRLESHGYYAAVELAGAAEILAMATARGAVIPARLRLEQRQKKVPGKPTLKYAVPIIEFVETRMAELQLTAGSGSGIGQALLAAGERPARPELPATLPPPSSDLRAPGPSSAGEPAAAAPAATASPGPGTGTDGMTQEQLLAGIEALGVSRDYAIETSKRLFPRDPNVALTDAQRRGLYDALAAEEPEGGPL